MSAEAIAEKDTPSGLTARAPWRVEHLEALPGFKLKLRFYDGTAGIADLASLVFEPESGLFHALRDEVAFATVSLELGVPVWPNGADLDPCWLYDEIAAHGLWKLDR